MGRKHQRRLEKSIREFRKEHNGQAPDSQDIKNIEKSYKKQRDENAREKKKEAREKDRKLAECRAAVEADMPFFTFKFGELDSLPDS